jgi:hypothetical protein
MKKALQYGLPLVLAAALLWWAYKDTNFDQMAADLRNAHYGWLALSLIPMMLSHWIRAERWRLLMQPLGFRPSAYNTFCAVMAGYFANMILPRMGEVTRCGLLQKNEDVPLDNSIGTVVVERIFDVLMLFFITALAFAIEFSTLTEFFMAKIEQKRAAGGSQGSSNIGFVLGGLFFAGIAALAVFWLMREKLMQIALVVKILDFLKGIGQGIASVAKMEKKGLFILYSLLIWVGYFATVYISFKALPYTASLGMVAALIILVVGSYAMAAPVQGGLGAYHTMVSLGLVELYAQTKQGADTSALLMHTSQTLLVIIIGAICFGLSVLAAKKKQNAAA